MTASRRADAAESWSPFPGSDAYGAKRSRSASAGLQMLLCCGNGFGGPRWSEDHCTPRKWG